jgi:hypothetical protein
MTIIGDAPSPAGAMPVRWLGYGLAIAGFALWLADVFRPDPMLALALLLVVPASLAVALLVPEAFQVRNRSRSSLVFSPFVIFPAMLVFVSGVSTQFVDISWPLAVGAGGAIFCLVAAFASRGRPGFICPWSMMLIVTIAGGLYGYGATAMADVQFDRSVATVIHTSVTSKYLTYGRHSSTYYHLKVLSWGPGPNSLNVSRSVYDALNPGDQVCVFQHAGALGAPWFKAGLCF